jgi:hypothetical protein
MIALKTGGIYRIYYSNWKTNIKPVVFILYQGISKVHALNISAIQLSHIDILKLVTIISKLSKLPGATRYTGRVLYRIFRLYARDQIKKCYRTYHTSMITKYSIVNYGLNKKEDFSNFELNFQSKEMYQDGSNRLVTRMLNFFNKKPAKLKSEHFAQTSRDSNLDTGDFSKVKSPAVPMKSATPRTSAMSGGVMKRNAVPLATQKQIGIIKNNTEIKQ